MGRPRGASPRATAAWSILVVVAVLLRITQPRHAVAASGSRLSAAPAAAAPVGQLAAQPGRRLLPDGAAAWAVLLLATVSMLLRPAVELLGLPTLLNNTDVLLTPPVLAVVLLDALLRRTLPPVTRWLLAALALLVVVALASWATGSPRSVTSLGLMFISLLLLPVAVVLVALVDVDPLLQPQTRRRSLAVLKALVLLQVVVCSVQYVVLGVAAKAPVGADLVDGTTSHNFWPTFALPAAAVLLVVDRGASRWLWPLAITVLAVYAEAKAAMIIFVPLIGVLLAVVLLSRGGPLRRRLGRPSWERASSAGITAGAVVVIAIGLVATPSVKSTWDVFLGHTRQLGSFVESGTGAQPNHPTLRDALTDLRAEVSASTSSFALGLGPANSVSHAAQVMVERSPASAGPVAARLLANPGDLQFEDAQSSVLGLWGDLGALGVLAYLAVMVLGLVAMLVPAAGWRALLSLRGLTLAYLGAAILGGGLPLDWPEQGSVVLPLTLVLLVVRGGSYHQDPI